MSDINVQFRLTCTQRLTKNPKHQAITLWYRTLDVDTLPPVLQCRRSEIASHCLSPQIRLTTMINANAKFSVSSYPYNFLVVEDLFDEGIAFALSSTFNDLIRGANTIGKVGEVGELIYEAVNFTPLLHHIQGSPVSYVASIEVKNLIAEVFDIRLDENLMLGMHRHNPPSKPGWTHTDFAVVSFPNIPPNFRGQRVYAKDSGVQYSDDSKLRQPDAIKTARAIACLYYTANSEWSQGMGGETGIYLPDGKTLVGSIPPKNNLLFAFEISPLSYHAYLGSITMQRSSYIWWYHSAPSYLIHRHRDAAEARRRMGLDPWDRWTDATVEKYEVPAFN